MSKYQLTFTLKQHTPIIHFQAHQQGATLRATEVKPKLDRFLIQKFKKENIDYKGWLVGNGEKPALNYKMRIEPVRDVKYYLFFSMPNQQRKANLKNYIERHYSPHVEVVAPSPYFANNDKVKFYSKKDEKERRGKKDQVKEIDYDKLRFALHTESNIRGLITCFNKELLKHIEQSLPDFFLAHNFGTRQSKGFGSFTVKSINGQQVNFDRERFKELFLFYKKIAGNKTSVSDKFKFIDDYYKRIRNKPGQGGGLSLIRDYFKEKYGIIWEKPALTKKLIKGQNFEVNNVHFVRALLGLAGVHEYQQFRKSIKIEHAENDSDKKIERFQSPIMFKVIDDKIYLTVPKETHLNEIKGKEFCFYTIQTLQQASKGEKLKLKVPKKFDLRDFLRKNT